MKIDWDPVRRELDHLRAVRKRAGVWWRDDDAVVPSAQLELLFAAAARHDAPIALAVIPQDATRALADATRRRNGVSVLVHGWSHENHAPEDAKKSEFTELRPLSERMEDAAAGLMRLRRLFPGQLRRVFAPPWNRLGRDMIPKLAALGFDGVSTYGPRAIAAVAPGLTQTNTHIDPIDWRGGRGLVHPTEIVKRFATLLAARRVGEADPSEPIGLLTHHLVHDRDVWSFVDAFGEMVAREHDVLGWRSI